MTAKDARKSTDPKVQLEGRRVSASDMSRVEDPNTSSSQTAVSQRLPSMVLCDWDRPRLRRWVHTGPIRHLGKAASETYAMDRNQAGIQWVGRTRLRASRARARHGLSPGSLFELCGCTRMAGTATAKRSKRRHLQDNKLPWLGPQNGK